MPRLVCFLINQPAGQHHFYQEGSRGLRGGGGFGGTLFSKSVPIQTDVVYLPVHIMKVVRVVEGK